MRAIRTALLAAAAAGAMCLPASAQEVGNVRAVQTYGYGTPPQGSRVPKYPRDAVVTAEYLETVPKGAMVVRFRDDTELTIGENARITVDRFVYDPSTARGEQAVNVTRGAFRFVTGKMNKEGIRIETPVSTIGVRGTTVVGRHDEATNTTELSIVDGEGLVWPRGARDPIVVPAGTTMIVQLNAYDRAPVFGFVRTNQHMVDRLGVGSLPAGFVPLRRAPGQQGDNESRSSSSFSSPSSD